MRESELAGSALRYALVGHGKMGRAVEAAAAARGHRCVAVVDPKGPWPDTAAALRAGALEEAEVVFEFTQPRAALANVVALLKAGQRVVCGTTGWDPEAPEVTRALEQGGGALLAAPNFSLGMHLFYAVVREAAQRLVGSGLYEPFVVEWHHRAKADCPSGTALRLARIVAGAGGGERAVVVGGTEAVPRGAVHVTGVRAGHEPGRHMVGFDGEHDAVELVHRSRGRSGLAWGAVLAGEWLARGRRGRCGFEEVVADLLAQGGGA